jgi:hypothetical protein
LLLHYVLRDLVWVLRCSLTPRRRAALLVLEFSSFLRLERLQPLARAHFTCTIGIKKAAESQTFILRVTTRSYLSSSWNEWKKSIFKQLLLLPLPLLLLLKMIITMTMTMTTNKQFSCYEQDLLLLHWAHWSGRGRGGRLRVAALVICRTPDRIVNSASPRAAAGAAVWRTLHRKLWKPLQQPTQSEPGTRDGEALRNGQWETWGPNPLVSGHLERSLDAL